MLERGIKGLANPVVRRGGICLTKCVKNVICDQYNVYVEYAKI